MEPTPNGWGNWIKQTLDGQLVERPGRDLVLREPIQVVDAPPPPSPVVVYERPQSALERAAIASGHVAVILCNTAKGICWFVVAAGAVWVAVLVIGWTS